MEDTGDPEKLEKGSDEPFNIPRSLQRPLRDRYRNYNGDVAVTVRLERPLQERYRNYNGDVVTNFATITASNAQNIL